MMKSISIFVSVLVLMLVASGAAAVAGIDYRVLADDDDFVMPVIVTTEYRTINDTLPGDNISLLAVRYDRDHDGILTEDELRITYRDYMHSQLTPRESAQFIELIGFIPVPAGHMGYGLPQKIVKPVKKAVLPEVDTYIEGSYCGVWSWSDDHTWSVDTKHYLMFGDRNNAIIRNNDIKTVGIIGNDNTVYVPEDADPTVYGRGENNEVVPYSEAP